MTAKTIFASIAALGFVAACEPIPSSGCQPQTGAGGRVIVACTPDGRPVVMQPQTVAPAAPATVQSTPLPASATSAQTTAPQPAAPYGITPVMTGATGEALPPIPETLTPIPAPTRSSTTAPAPTRSPVPARTTNPNAVPATIAPPPASVTATFPVQ